MKTKFFKMGLSTFLLITICTLLLSCNSDDDLNKTIEIATNEASANPKERIVGSWLLVRINEEDKTDLNRVYTFMADGSWTVSPPLVDEFNPNAELMVTFKDGWVYNADKDVITGYLDFVSPSVEKYPHRFELKRSEFILSYEPQGMINFMPPTPHIVYLIRK